MKKWYEELDEATKQRIKTYSAFNDWESKDLMLQTLHEAEQKEIEEFKETNHELAELAIARKQENKDLADCNARLLTQATAATKRVVALEQENAELKTDKQYWEQKANRLTTEWGETLDQLAQAKKIIKNILELELLPETKEVKQAEQFIQEEIK